MPITRFIWDSLPVDRLVHRDERFIMPKVVDYACGAGHFLTEAIESINAYFNHIGKPEMIENNSWVEKSIFGIEKDYRLARVSKVSLFMNGAGQARIIFGDGLECYPEKGIENGKFDVLVANPPYSVDAFKNHLVLKNNKFDILDSITNNGSEIETLFVERIAQLLKPQGVAAVILPSSILSNNNPSSYTKAREHILKNFLIRAIVCFGSKTFGATSTSTVTLFLEKYSEPPTRYKLIEDSANAIISGVPLTNWEDQDILDAYLSQIGIPENIYNDFISENYDYNFFTEHEYFNNYINAFLKSSAITNRKKQKTFKRLTEEGQSAELNSRFYKFVKAIEKEKLFFFGLTRTQHTLVITAPSDNSEQKAFLGYDWSNRKGKEGIVITNPGGKLYNNSDRYAPNTVANAIRLAFEDATIQCDMLDGIAQYMRLKDMLDFSRTTFDKSIRTTVKKSISIKSNFPVVSIGKFAGESNIKKGTAITKSETIEGKYKVVAGGLSFAYTHNTYNREANIITISASGANAGFVNFWEERIFASDCVTIYTENIIKTKYIYYYLKAYQNLLYSARPQQAGQPHFYKDNLMEFPIPDIPYTVQKKIVDECEIVDTQFINTRMTIQEYEDEIQSLFSSLEIAQLGGVKLSNTEHFKLMIGQRILNKELKENGKYPVFSTNVLSPFGYIDKTIISEFNTPSILWGIDGDWMVNYIPSEFEFTPTDHCGVLRVTSDDFNTHYVAFALKSIGDEMGFSRSYRASIDRIESITIPKVSKTLQDEVMSKIEVLQSKILELENNLNKLKESRTSIVLDNI